MRERVRMRSTGGSASVPAAPAAAATAAAIGSTHPLLRDVQAALQEIADPAVAAGYDHYCRGVVKHRGLRYPAVDAACKRFIGERGLAGADARQLGLALLRQPLQEDKVAGCNMLAHWMLKGGGAARWRAELAELERLYSQGHVFWWSTCDRVCSRVLTPTLKQLLKQAPPEGEAAARAVLGWCRHDNLWLRRTSVVSLVTLARHPDSAVFPGFRSCLLEALDAVVRCPERFAQTGAGWVLREVGKGDSRAMLEFVEPRLLFFSREGLRYALEHQPPAVRTGLMDAHKAQQAARAATAGPAAAAASGPVNERAGRKRKVRRDE